LAVSVTDTMRNVRLKTFLLMIWFGALVLALGWVIGYLFGNVSLWDDHSAGHGTGANLGKLLVLR